MSQISDTCIHCGWKGPSKRPCCAGSSSQVEPLHDKADPKTPSKRALQPHYGRFRVTRSTGGPLVLTTIAKSPKKRRPKNTKAPVNVLPRGTTTDITQYHVDEPVLALMTTFGAGPSPQQPPNPMPMTVVCTSTEVYESQHALQFHSALRHGIPPKSRRVDIWRWLRPLDHDQKLAYERGVIPSDRPSLSQRPKTPWIACLFCE
jgi:hypothetical protein